MATQSIIVYRNPAEEVLWNSILSPEGFAILAGIVVFFIALLIVSKVVERTRYWNSYMPIGVGAIVSLTTVWWLLSRI